MSTKTLPVDQILTMLAGAPSRIDALTADLTPAQLRTPPDPGEWSANDVLAHLRSCADMWGGAISVILAQDKPTIKAVNPTTWIKQTDYLDQQFQPSLQVYTVQRADLLTVLKVLTPEAWSRSATITGAGKPLTKTVLSYAERIVIHERPHIKQIQAIANALRT